MTTNYQPAPAAPYAPVPAAPAPRKPRRWLAVVFVVLAFLLGLAIGGAGGGSSSETPAAEPAAEAPAVEAPVEEAPAVVEPEAPAEPEGIAPGQYIVGTTIEPGRYTMTVTEGGMGYVDQKNGDEYLAQEVGTDSGSTIVVDLADVPGSIVTLRDVENVVKVG